MAIQDLIELIQRSLDLPGQSFHIGLLDRLFNGVKVGLDFYSDAFQVEGFDLVQDLVNPTQDLPQL